jgi:nucleotide-binding universal stress UspA family protein
MYYTGDNTPGNGTEASVSNPILVATDGGRGASSALKLAARCATERGVPIEVVSVVEPLSDLPMPLPHRDELEHAHAQGIAERVREEIRDHVGPVDWPIHIRLGRPAPAICTTARERDARMVILSVDSGDTQEGNATAVELLHLADKPVLVARLGDVPTSAAVGIDFRPSSVRAAEEVVELLGPGARVHLVHVKPSLDFPAASVWGWEPCYQCAVDGAFDRLVERLSSLGGARIERHCRGGDPVEQLLASVDELGVDMLGIGSDGYICNGRVVVGRVARRVLATSPVPVLATPVATSLEGPFAETPRSERDRTGVRFPH